MDGQVANLLATFFIESFGKHLDTSIKLLSLGVISSLIVTLIKWAKSIGQMISVIKRTEDKTIVIKKDSKDDSYYYVDKWIMSNYAQHVVGVSMDRNNGEPSLSPYFMKMFTFDWQGHAMKMYKTITKNEVKPTEDGKMPSNEECSIHLSSKTASFDELKSFINECCTTMIRIDNGKRKTLSKPLIVNTLSCPSRGKNKKDKPVVPEWNRVITTTNKDMLNTILSKSVENEFTKDIQLFMDSENWYAEKGVPFKRGYFLYGPGGTGKTSIIKSVASHYQAEIFSISMSAVKDDDVLIQAVNEIRNIAHSKFVILALEDLDRSEIFDDRRYDDEQNRPLLQGLLQILDGVNENYAQITFITANNPEKIENACSPLFKLSKL